MSSRNQFARHVYSLCSIQAYLWPKRSLRAWSPNQVTALSQPVSLSWGGRSCFHLLQAMLSAFSSRSRRFAYIRKKNQPYLRTQLGSWESCRETFRKKDICICQHPCYVSSANAEHGNEWKTWQVSYQCCLIRLCFRNINCRQKIQHIYAYCQII